MLKKLAILLLVALYLYTLAFDIFLNKYFRLPTPILFGVPLVFLFGSLKKTSFVYGREIILLGLALFMFYGLAQNSVKNFWVCIIVIVSCAAYFNFFVATDLKRFNQSIWIFMGLLFFSSVIMVLNHMQPSRIDALRTVLLGRPIDQSPTGISASIFNYGYQLAALTGFIFIYSLKFRLKPIIQGAIFLVCVYFIFLGMQRSVVVTFLGSVGLFLIFYYKSKAIYVFGIIAVLGVGLINFFNFADSKESKYDNVMSKNERKGEDGEDRSQLVTENLKIYADYPLGLIFYGKTWGDVTEGSRVFRNGLTSHNAYLMFITYLGPFVGLGLLFAIYYPIFRIFKFCLADIRGRSNAMLICLCFAFLAVSANSLFHNGWLLNNGPTAFLYFAVLHLYKLTQINNRTQVQAPKVEAPELEVA